MRNKYANILNFQKTVELIYFFKAFRKEIAYIIQ